MDIELVGRADLWTYQSCDSYNESPLTQSYVDAGKLPPVNERMPKEPWMNLSKRVVR